MLAGALVVTPPSPNPGTTENRKGAAVPPQDRARGCSATSAAQSELLACLSYQALAAGRHPLREPC